MLRTLMIATALLTASGTALADKTYVYGGVTAVEPGFAVSFGTGPYGGVNMMYSSGGYPYWGAVPYLPPPVVVVPPPPPPRYRVAPAPYYRYGYGYPYYGHGGKGNHHGGRPEPYRYEGRKGGRYDRD
ncbi:MAG: hypothetical protein GC183_09595 [Thiobacillus sp.]|nr:hypothetical protein [Thiobacillus sp.]